MHLLYYIGKFDTCYMIYPNFSEFAKYFVHFHLRLEIPRLHVNLLLNKFTKLFLFSSCLSFLMPYFAEAQWKPKLDPSRSNPGISVNALLLGRGGNKGKSEESETPNGFHIQELETRFTSNVDTYFRGDIVLAVENEEGEFKVEPEEIFVETLSLPYFTVKAGKFYALIDRHNHLHTHSFPFIDSLVVNESILGEEGLNEVGVSVSYLFPTPWYFEVVGQGFSGRNEELFNSDTQNDVAGVLFVQNLWDLSDAATFEVDFAYGNGENSFDGRTSLFGASMTYKWRPVKKSIYQSFAWTTQYLRAHRDKAEENEKVGGISSWIMWQFAKRWWLQGRGEYLGLPGPEEGKTRKYSVLLGLVFTEYSALRLQYDYVNRDSEEKHEHRVSLQFNVSLGTHPAHYY